MKFAVFVAFSTLLQAQYRVDLSKLVVVGDSLSAGVENLSLLDTQQVHGYASVIAEQAEVPLVLPLIPFPGAPNKLALTSLNPINIAPVAGSLPPVPRDNPCHQPTNLSVPGVTLEQALTLRPPQSPGSPVGGWLNLVLGFPNPLAASACHTSGVPRTAIEQAVALKPTAIIEWLGNNDALVPALTGAISTLTPVWTFATNYDALLDQLAQTHAPIITATIPDVTKVPYFTPLATFAAQVNLPVGVVAAKLGVGINDFLRPTAPPVALRILTGQQPGPLPQACPAPPFSLPVNSVPCVLSAKDAEAVRDAVDAYNMIIAWQSLVHGATMVDSHALIDELAASGYKADGKLLTTGFLGGLISLDGIHPTKTGYAIIANKFIEVMNSEWRTDIKEANVNKIAAHDPLVPPIKLNQQ